jgi:hypothetical protein
MLIDNRFIKNILRFLACANWALGRTLPPEEGREQYI